MAFEWFLNQVVKSVILERIGIMTDLEIPFYIVGTCRLLSKKKLLQQYIQC